MDSSPHFRENVQSLTLSTRFEELSPLMRGNASGAYTAHHF